MGVPATGTPTALPGMLPVLSARPVEGGRG
jgi:hypothetical protein